MSGRADYEERRQTRIDRLNDASAKATEESKRQYKRSHDLVKDIPFGQPNIEGRPALPNLRKKSWNALEKAIESDKAATYCADRAEAAENNGVISSDNPEAINLLQEKIDNLKEKQAFMKKVNTYYRKHKTCVGCEGVTEESANELDESMKTAYSWETAPFPSYRLTSINTKIKVAQQRIDKLKTIEKMPAETIQFDGGEVISNIDINRVQIKFDERQDTDMVAKLKAYGFHWSPSEKAWQRLRNKNAWHAAKTILKIEEV